MERLTERDEFGNADIIALSDVMPELYAELSFSETNALTDALNRLAAYEDTGLEPEEIEKLCDMDRRAKMAEMLRDEEKNGISTDRLRELVQADRDGRCIILPAKIGDTVYHITTCKNFPQVLDVNGTMYDANEGYGTATGLYCPCELMKNCPFPCDNDGGFDCDKHKNTLEIFEDIVDSIHIEDMEDYIIFNYSGSADFEDFGKTVFLTREAAEKHREGEHNG